MKTAEELLKEKGITPETVHHNYAYVYRVVCDLIGEAQKEAYNQALEDAAENVEIEACNEYQGEQFGYLPIRKQSILKLKK